MDQSKAAGADQAKRTYKDFEPFCRWHNNENVVQVHLHGYRKEHLSVGITLTGMLTIHGERPLNQTNSTWSRFHKEIKLPNNCDSKRVAGKLADGVLTIIMPPKVAPPQSQSSHEKLPQPISNNETQPNNDAAMGILIKQNLEDTDEKAALLAEEVKPGSCCQLRQRSLASKKHIAVKLVVVVVAMVAALGFAAYAGYKHGHYSYSLEQTA